MLFGYLTFAICSLMVFRHKTSHLLVRVVGFIIGLLLISTTAFYSATMPIKELPVPAGNYKVGTTNFTLLDESREELLTDDPYDKRSLFVETWYPASPDAIEDAPAPRTLWQELYTGKMDRVKFFMNYLKAIRTNSYPEIPLDQEHRPYPLIIFNHGLQMFTAQNTILMEHLASHGYIIVSIGHPYQSLRVNLPGVGAVIPEFISSLRKFQEAMEWVQKASAPIVAAQDAMRQVSDPRGKAEIMLDAIKDSEMNNLVALWEADSRFVLDQLLSVNPSEFDFQKAIDTTRIGAMGMSLGGAVAAELCKADSRINAGINIDGLQFGNRNDLGLSVPFMMIYSVDDAGDNEFLRLDSQHDFHQYTFLRARHADFTDMTYIWPVMRIYGQLGSIPPDSMIELSNLVILNFWDHYFKNLPLRIFTDQDYPDLETLVQLKDSI
jgi:predicted dienelactone hydrolase